MNRRGTTIIELAVVLSIITVLTALGAIGYGEWLKNYEIERLTKEFYFDAMSLRVMAMERRHEHYLVMDHRSYTLYEDINENCSPDAGEEIPSFPKKLKYGLSWNGASTVTFNPRGLISPNQTVSFPSGPGPDYNCIVIYRTRINIGRVVNGVCNAE